MKKLLLPKLKSLLFILPLIFFVVGCDDNCRFGECPADQFSLKFEIQDTSGINCASVNPDLYTFLLTSNESYSQNIVSIFNGKLNLNVQSSINEYILKYNETDSIVIDLVGDNMIVECCGNQINVHLTYNLIERRSQENICSNCSSFDLIVPNCE